MIDKLIFILFQYNIHIQLIMIILLLLSFIASANFFSPPSTYPDYHRIQMKNEAVDINERILFEGEQEDQKYKQNDQVFQKLRGGLNNWPDQTSNQKRLRQNPPEQIIEKINAVRNIIKQSQYQQEIDELQLQKEALLIQKEDLVEQIHHNQNHIQKSNQKQDSSIVKYIIYFAIFTFIAFFLFKWIKIRFFQQNFMIQAQQQAETLTEL